MATIILRSNCNLSLFFLVFSSNIKDYSLLSCLSLRNLFFFHTTFFSKKKSRRLLLRTNH